MGLLGWLQVSLSWALVSCAVNWIHLQEIDNNINGCDSQYRQHMIDHVLRKSNPKSLPVFEPSSINVTFYLLTSSNQNTSTKLTTGDIRSLRKSSFNSSNPTRIIVHGFCNCHLSEFCVTTRQKLLEHPQQYNVITMSWPSGKWILSYWTARWRIVPASQILAKFIDFLHSDGGMKLQDLYLVGHSLGAHLSGLAGKLVTSGKVGTIVGLDPAKPEFDVGKPDERLAITDASYVEVIHTNGKRLGLYEPIGHSDFYPNGGVNQPGCLPWWFGASCAHGRAWELYAESIESKLGFWSTLCSSLDKVRDTGCRSPKAKLKMGGDPIIQKGSGILTVQTNAKAPYAVGKLELDNRSLKVVFASAHRFKTKAPLYIGFNIVTALLFCQTHKATVAQSMLSIATVLVILMIHYI